MAELPNLEEKDVNVELTNGILTISGEKKSEAEDKERRFSERYYVSFERTGPSPRRRSIQCQRPRTSWNKTDARLN